MKPLVVIVLADTKPMAQAIRRYLAHVAPREAEVYFSDYEDASLMLSGRLNARVDLVILECYRTYGPDQRRNEGIQVAKRFAQAGKRVLLFSTLIPRAASGVHFLWDPLGKRPLSEALDAVLDGALLTDDDLQQVESVFPNSRGHLPHGHRHGHDHSSHHGSGHRPPDSSPDSD